MILRTHVPPMGRTDRLDRVWQRGLAFLELTKPRIVSLVLITTCVGFYLASLGIADYRLLLHTLLGTALAAGGTLALNQVLEREADAKMRRTQLRPLPDGRVQPIEAGVFGTLLGVTGLVYLAWTVNLAGAAVTAVIVVSYLGVYTPLKKTTSLCTLVGAVPGALPPVIGWAAVRGSIDLEAWILFAIMFLWQMPHSLAIAWLYRDDYARAGFQLLPVINPDGKSTGRQVTSHCLALLAVGLLPTLVGLAGPLYFCVAFGLGSMFLWYSVRLALARSPESARRLLFASLIYLPLLLAVMAFDKAPL